MKKLPIKHIDKEKYNQMLGWWNFKSDDGNSPKFKARILDWVHGDEWGGNFNILDKDDLYAIDLEDVLHYQDGQVGNGIVGGLHAWRFIGPDPPKQYNFEENTSIPEETFNAIPEETFNAYCGMGRLLAALVQKSVAIYRGTESNFKNQDRRGYINDSIHIMWDVITHETKDNSDHETTPFQVWVAFVDWLAYWKNKHDDYFIENDFVVAFNKIKKLAEGNN